MTALAVIGLMLGGITTYLIGGSLCVLGVAWVNARVSEFPWFSGDRPKRWTDNQLQEELPPPVAVMLLWPLVIIAGLAYYVGRGFFRLTERAADTLIARAAAARKLGGTSDGRG